MPAIHPLASSALTATRALLDAATERGDVAQAAADALRAGRILYLLADTARGALAEEIAASLRRRFPDPLWPPVIPLTAGTRLLALIGCEHGASGPLSHQAEMLLCQGDVALLVLNSELSPDLLSAAALAVTQGATVAGLGMPPSPIQANPAILLPEAPVERLIECQLALGNALAEALARLLPAERPADVEPALVSFGCMNCDAPLTIPRHLAGRRGVCPYCFNNTTLAPDLPTPENEKRAHMRFALRQVALRVSLVSPTRAPLQLPGQIVLENLSPGGLLFTLIDSRLELQPDDPLLIELSTPAFQRPLTLNGSVKRVTREAKLCRVGVAFRELRPAIAERLHILESNLVLRHLSPRERD